jgi:hypothetical protein
MRTCGAVLVVGLALVAADPARAGDLIVRQRSAGARDGQVTPWREQTQYFAGETVVMEDARLRTIVDLAAGTLTVVDKTDRTYTVDVLEELRARVERTREAVGATDAQDRAALGVDTPATVEATGRTRTIAGRPAAEYTIRASRGRARVWIGTDLEVPDGARRWRELSAGLHVFVRPGTNLETEVARLKGLPLRTDLTLKVPRARGWQTVKTWSEVVEVRETPVPAELRTVPTGFTERTGDPADS